MPKKSQSRQEFFDDLTHHSDGSFAILIVGRPGISKSRILRDWANSLDKQNHHFASKDLSDRLKERDEPVQILGRSDLMVRFPYIDAVFESGYSGLNYRDELLREFHEELQESAILAFDDLDYIPFSTQVQLFDVLTTDPSGKNLALNDKLDVQATLPQIIAMVNRPLPELYAQPHRHYRLLFERLAQQVFYLPEIRNYTRAEKDAAFRSIWKDLNFVDFKQQPVNFDSSLNHESQTELLDWIDGLPLECNYRDLQVIAIALFRELTRPQSKPISQLIEAVNEVYETSRLLLPS